MNTTTSEILPTTHIGYSEEYKILTTTIDSDASMCLPVIKAESMFPDDYFTIEQRRNGAILFHIFLAVYVLGK